jgi:hypothetical protein
MFPFVVKRERAGQALGPTGSRVKGSKIVVAVQLGASSSDRSSITPGETHRT